MKYQFLCLFEENLGSIMGRGLYSYLNYDIFENEVFIIIKLFIIVRRQVQIKIVLGKWVLWLENWKDLSFFI